VIPIVVSEVTAAVTLLTGHARSLVGFQFA
jgi:hypothetical protein